MAKYSYIFILNCAQLVPSHTTQWNLLFPRVNFGTTKKGIRASTSRLKIVTCKFSENDVIFSLSMICSSNSL